MNVQRVMSVQRVPLKRLIDPSRPITYGIVQAGPDIPGGVPYIRPIDMRGHLGVDVASLQRTTPEIAAAYSRSSLAAGDIVISIGPSYGKTMLVGAELEGANLTQGTARVAPAPSVDVSYLMYALQSSEAIGFWDSSVGGATFRALNLGPLSNTPVPLHPYSDQRKIADYLDRETAEIDEALVEQKNLRDLLVERRTEIITAATRPSNPELEKAPTVRLRHVTSLNPSPRLNIPSNSIQPFPLYSMDSISEFGPLRSPVFRPYSELVTGYSYLEPTDVAYAKVTPCFENGKGLVGTELGGPSFATTELTVLRPAPEVDQNYLALVLQSSDFYAVGEASMTGAGGLKRVSEHTARNYRFPLPDKKTQARIVERVRLEVDSTDVLIADSNRLSDLLLERRAALISAAVTGQIDVTAQGMSAAEQLQDELEAKV